MESNIYVADYIWYVVYVVYMVYNIYTIYGIYGIYCICGIPHTCTVYRMRYVADDGKAVAILMDLSSCRQNTLVAAIEHLHKI